MGQPAPPLLQGLHRGLLLRPAHRQAAAAPAQQGADRPDRLPGRRDPAPLPAGRPRRRPASGPRVPGPLRARLLLPRGPVERDEGPARRQRPAGPALRGRGHPAGGHRRRPLRRPQGRPRPRRAHVHRLGQDARRRATHQARHRRPLHHRRRRDGGGPPPVQGGHRQHPAHRRALQRRAAARPELPPPLPAPRRRHRERVHRQAGALRPRQALRRDLLSLRPRPGPLPRPAGAGARRHRPDGVHRLLPHRPGLHQLGQAARRPGGAGARLRRRLDRGLGAAHHRHRPHPLEAALRALPQPRARLDARLRHRLLPGPARRGDRLRPRQVRPRQRRPDHHLRLAQGPVGDPRRGPGHGAPLRRGRPHRQAGPRARPGQDGAPQGPGVRRARQGRQAGPAARAAAGRHVPEAGPALAVDRRAGEAADHHHPRPARDRHEPRGAQPPGRPARRRRGDRRQAALGVRPGLHGRQVGHAGLPVRQGRRRRRPAW